MVRPERGRGIKGHAFGDVVVGGVVVDDRLRDGERGQSCYGDHGGGGHHGVEDERQAVGHVPVRGAGQSWSVTWGETAEEGRLKKNTVLHHVDCEQKAAAGGWRPTVLIHRQHTGSLPQQLLDHHR